MHEEPHEMAAVPERRRGCVGLQESVQGEEVERKEEPCEGGERGHTRRRRRLLTPLRSLPCDAATILPLAMASHDAAVPRHRLLRRGATIASIGRRHAQYWNEWPPARGESTDPEFSEGGRKAFRWARIARPAWGTKTFEFER